MIEPTSGPCLYEELYYHPWSFRRVKGSGFATGLNNETKFMTHGKLIRYLDGEIIFYTIQKQRIIIRERRNQTDLNDDLRKALS